MKAAQFNRYGNRKVVTVSRSAPQPALGDGQVLVTVRTSILNAVNIAGRSGMLPDQTAEAFHFFETGDPRGKVVVMASA